MAIGVMVKGVGKRLFPDDMAPDQIRNVLQDKFPMGTADRMARAKEQGFGDTVYHGTNADISEFEARGAVRGDGVFVTNDPETAGKYARFAGNEGQNIQALRVRGAIAGESPSSELNREISNAGLVPLKGEKAVDAWKRLTDQADEPSVRGIFEKAGFSGVETTNKRGKVNSLVFDPRSLRSTNAAFDPAKSNSANLLAGSGALAVGIGAAGQSGQAEAGGLGKAARASARALQKSIEAKAPGVKLSLGGGEDYTTLSKIIVPKEQRNLGTGSKVMDDVTKWADESGETVALTPSSDFGGSKAKLVPFYKRFGFVENKGRNKDYAISESMYRLPATGAILAAGTSSAKAASQGTIQAASVPELQQAAEVLEMLELPVIGKPFQGLADWARGAAYNDKDKLKRALTAALDLI